MSLHPVITEVTNRIAERSAKSRQAYLARVADAASEGPVRAGLGCSNLAHGFAACSGPDLLTIQPLAEFPDWIKSAAREAGGVAQFAGGVPAMCDGITQGRSGMELSLFSRDVIAMATGIAASATRSCRACSSAHSRSDICPPSSYPPGR